MNEANILEAVLDNACKWSTDWHLYLNVQKCCHFFVGTALESDISSANGEIILQVVKTTKDLVLLTDSSFKPSVRFVQAANKSCGILFLIKRYFPHLTADILVPVYVSLVRPIVEYGTQASSTYLLKGIQHIERVQQLATMMVFGLKYLPYEQRPLDLNIFSLEGRRL